MAKPTRRTGIYVVLQPLTHRLFLIFVLAFHLDGFTGSTAHSAQTLLQESTKSDINYEQRLALLQKAYDLAVENGDINSSGNALYEICVIHLEQGATEAYSKKRKTFNDYYESYKDNTTALLMRLLDIEQNLRSSNHNEVVAAGEPLLKEINAADLTRKSRLEDGIYQFTLADFARLNNFLGISYFSLGQYEFSHNYFSESLKFNLELGHQSVVASLLGNLSAVSWSQNDFTRALDYTEQAIEILEGTDATQTLLRNILNKGVYLVELGRNAEAKDIFKQVIQHPDIKNYPGIKISALYNLASALIEQREFADSEAYLNEAMVLSIQLNDEMSINDVNQQLAQLKVAQQEYDKAIPLLQQTLQYYQGKGLKRDLAETYKILSGVYRNLKRYQEALEMLDAYYSLMLELQNESRQKAITEFQEKFEAKQREVEIQELKSLNALNELKVESRNSLIKAVVAIGILIILMIWNQLRHKQKLANQFEVMSLTDPLTKIGNRRFFKANIDRELAMTKRQAATHGQACLGLFIFDIDYFKKLNDTYGHDAGDAVLVEFANRLKTTLRNSDLLARWGGEEFVVAARINTSEDIGLVASRILTAINKSPFQVANQTNIDVTCSIGGVTYPLISQDDLIPDWHLLINLADYALYQAKENGRNQWQIVANKSLTSLDEVIDITGESLQRLFDNGKLFLTSSTEQNDKFAENTDSP